MTDLHVVVIPQLDSRLGRNVVHDPRSRGFALNLPMVVDPSTWRTKSIRIYDPTPNPNQPRGNCTGCSKCHQLNAVGNRKAGRVLGMKDADRIYSLATSIDPWPGAWPPEDTGSSGLAAAKAAQRLGLGGEYRWLFGGADEVVQAVMAGMAVSVGTSWFAGMFDKDSRGAIQPTGPRVGGHQWTIHGYDLKTDDLIGLCWWGPEFRNFRIKRSHVAELLADDGDAHCQSQA